MITLNKDFILHQNVQKQEKKQEIRTKKQKGS
jgi:hypothetical protein